MTACALCGKNIIIKHRHLGYDFCSGCYGYAVIFCHKPEDVGKYGIDQLEELHRKESCDLCGKKVPVTGKKFICDGMICRDCEKLLRPYYDNSDDKKAALLLNGIDAVVSVAADIPATAYTADDPMESAGIGTLRELYLRAKGNE